MKPQIQPQAPKQSAFGGYSLGKKEEAKPQI